MLGCSAHNSYQRRRAKEHECGCNCRREGEDDAEHAHLEPCHGSPLAEDDQGHTGAGCCHSGQTDRHRANLRSHHLPGGKERHVEILNPAWIKQFDDPA